MRTRYWTISQSNEDDDAEILIFGDITSWPWEESDVSSYSLARQLQDIKAHHISVRINSYGGEVAEGFAIYNALVSHPAAVTTYCDGFACSAASVIFMAGDERVMGDASALMIHNASTIASGNPAQLRKTADDLQKISDISMQAYLSRVNITEDEVRRMMDNETWISPSDAVDMGFATAVAADTGSGSPTQSARHAVYAAIFREDRRVPAFDSAEMAEAIASAVVRQLGAATMQAPAPEEPEKAEDPETDPVKRLLNLFS